MKILLGTTNKGKIEEFNKLFLGLDLEIISLASLPKVEEPVENGKNFYDNAVIKAKFYYEKYQIPVICDDSGLCCDALDGKPGIFTARYASLDGKDSDPVKNYMKLLADLEGISDRKAHFECVMVFYDGNNIISTEGRLDGEIALKPDGVKGFGYDPVFYLPEFGMTVANLDLNIKNKISHRAKASNKMLEALKNYINN